MIRGHLEANTVVLHTAQELLYRVLLAKCEVFILTLRAHSRDVNVPPHLYLRSIVRLKDNGDGDGDGDGDGHDGGDDGDGDGGDDDGDDDGRGCTSLGPSSRCTTAVPMHPVAFAAHLCSLPFFALWGQYHQLF